MHWRRNATLTQRNKTVNDAIDGRIQELTETLQDIKDECKKALAEDNDSNWRTRLDAILYLCNAALVEE